MQLVKVADSQKVFSIWYVQCTYKLPKHSKSPFPYFFKFLKFVVIRTGRIPYLMFDLILHFKPL